MIELAVLDMAGTTVDDGGRVYDALRQAVEETGATVAQKDLQDWMGTDKVTAIINLMQLGGVEPTDEAAQKQFLRFKQILSESYRAHPPIEIGGAAAMLRELQSRGIKVALTTGFDRDVVSPLLASLGWAVVGQEDAEQAVIVLDAVVTTDDVSAGRPAPYMVQRAMERTGTVDAHRVLVAGDTVVDVMAGRNAGAISCAVLTGGATRDVLRNASPHHILESVAEIPNLPATRPECSGTCNVDATFVPDNDYLLLTPGPLSTTKTVRAAMLRDWCTWDADYKQLTESVRSDLLALAQCGDDHSVILMQGSGTFAVESVIGSTLGMADQQRPGKLLVLANGAYGRRIAQIAAHLRIAHEIIDFGDLTPVNIETARQKLAEDHSFTHAAMVHCETTTGVLNPLREFCAMTREHDLTCIVDAMSSFGGVPMNVADLGIDFLISSANKCIQGVPGFGFVIARRDALENTAGRSTSLSLDLYDQWQGLENGHGKWRFTSPTHVVHSFAQALVELTAEGGVEVRHERYRSNQQRLIKRFHDAGLDAVIAPEAQSPIITAFGYPTPDFDFAAFYEDLKQEGFVIYPGKVSEVDTFRIGTIGEVYPDDVDRLADAVVAHRKW